MDDIESKFAEIEGSFLDLARKAKSVSPAQLQEFELVLTEKLMPFQQDLITVIEKVSRVRELLYWIGGAVMFNTSPAILRDGLLELVPELDNTWIEAKAAFQRLQEMLGVPMLSVSENSEDLEWLVVQTLRGIEACRNDGDNGDILRRVISRNRLSEKPLQARKRLNKGGRPKGLSECRTEIARRALFIFIKVPNATRLQLVNSLIEELETNTERTDVEQKMLEYLRKIPYIKRGNRLRRILHEFGKLSE